MSAADCFTAAWRRRAPRDRVPGAVAELLRLRSWSRLRVMPFLRRMAVTLVAVMGQSQEICSVVMPFLV
jgi:hypothetical protein